MSCNTEPKAVPIAVDMTAISAMNSSASGKSSGYTGRKPAARQKRNTILPWISATVALPSVRPSTISNLDIGATSVSFRKAELAVPDDLDTAEDGREQDGHCDDARRQELHIVTAAGAGEGGAKPKTERQQKHGQLPSAPIMRARARKYRFNCRSHRIKTGSAAAAPHPMHCPHAVDRRRFGLADAMPGQRNERVLQRAAAGLLPQYRGGTLCDDPAVVDDRNPVRYTLLHVMRREKHHHVLVAAGGTDELPDMVAVRGSSPAVGSSRDRILGRCCKARAISKGTLRGWRPFIRLAEPTGAVIRRRDSDGRIDNLWWPVSITV
jgi:hypothetical protein